MEESTGTTEKAEDREEHKRMLARGRESTLFHNGRLMLLSPQPLVREMGEPDHVGLFVLKFPISSCKPGDHDEVGLRSSSTKGGTLCPV